MDYSKKPRSMSINDFLIKHLAEEINLPKTLVKDIVSDHFRQSLQEIKKQDVASITISGLGRFRVSVAKVDKRVNECKKLLRMIEETPKKHAEFTKWHVEERLAKLLQKQQAQRIFDEQVGRNIKINPKGDS